MQNPLACQLTYPPGISGVISEYGFYLDHQWKHENYRYENGDELPDQAGGRQVYISQHNMGHDSVAESARLFQTVFISVKVRSRRTSPNLA